MKKLFYLLVAVGLVVAVALRTFSAPQDPALKDAVASSARPEALKTLLADTDKKYHSELAYLITHMDATDRDTMSLPLLIENVYYAHQARNRFAWAKSLPEEVYLTDVLPYHVVDEVRDAWRKELYELCAPIVDTCQTMEQAIRAINGQIGRAHV